MRVGIPHGRCETVTLVARLRLRGLLARRAFDRRMNAATFEQWVEKRLVPTLAPGDVAIMDDLCSHGGPRVEEPIKAPGTELRYPPPYGPDMNPIATAQSKLKSFLRKIAERTVAGLPTPSMPAARFSSPENV